MRRTKEEVVIYQINSDEIKKALLAYVNDTKSDCGKLGFASDCATITMSLNKDRIPVTAEISEKYKCDEED